MNDIVHSKVLLLSVDSKIGRQRRRTEKQTYKRADNEWAYTVRP